MNCNMVKSDYIFYCSFTVHFVNTVADPDRRSFLEFNLADRDLFMIHLAGPHTAPGANKT